MLGLNLWQRKRNRGDEETAKGVFLPFSQPARKVSHNCSPLGQLILHLWDIILLSRAKARSTGIASDGLRRAQFTGRVASEWL